MMTKESALALLETATADLDVMEYSNGDIDVTVYDFEGFDKDWSEIMRELENPDLVDEIFNTLRAECVEFVKGFYTKFIFDGFIIEWGYASYDI